ncbi:MAG: RNA polymerase sigma factor [Pseudomonadota bacterium]
MGKDIRELFLAHRREVQAYLTRKLRNAETAADLTQETFLRLTERAGGNAAAVITHERSYLYRIAHNVAVDHLRRVGRERTDIVAPVELDHLADETPSPERAAGSRDELAVVRAAIRELPDRTQQIFVLARILGLTYREVAARLRVSESSVQKHLARATKHVMLRLRKP